MARVLTLLVGLMIVLSCTGALPPATSPGPTPVASATTAPTTSPSPIPTPNGTRPSPAGLLGAYPPMPTNDVPTEFGTEFQEVLSDTLADHQGRDSDSPGGITAAVIAPACGTWSGAIGRRIDAEPLTTDSQFLIASVTKTLTAAAVLTLAAEHKVDLDAPLSDYLPAGLAVDTNGATVGEALRMQTGLADADEKPFLQQAVAHPDQPIDPASLLEAMPSAKAPSGGDTDYVDANYILLGYVIERASGQSVAHAFRSLLLTDPALGRLVYQDEERPQGPLAMGNLDTGWYTTPGLQQSLHDSLESGYIPSRALAPRASTADAAVSDAPTLARWGYLLFGGSVVDDASLALMTNFAPGEVPYGMGAHDLAWPAGLHGLGHNGWDLGYVTTLLTRPDSGVTVAAMTNDQLLQGFWPVADQLADIAESCGR